MRVAYLITAYNDIKLLNTLINILTSEKKMVFIHFDVKYKADIEHIALNEYSVIIDNCIPIQWGGHGLSEAVIRLIEAAQSTGSFDYFHCISGSDLPVRPIAEFEAYLEKIFPKNILAAKPIDLNNFQQKKRLFSKYVINKRRFLNVIMQKIYFFIGTYIWRRKILPGVKFYFGNNWITVNNETAILLTKKWRDPIINKFFRETFCPDEIFFPTYTYAFNNGDSAHYDEIRFVVWNGQPRPKELTIEDLPAIRDSRRYFARKFHSDTSKELIKIIINNDISGFSR